MRKAMRLRVMQVLSRVIASCRACRIWRHLQARSRVQVVVLWDLCFYNKFLKF